MRILMTLPLALVVAAGGCRAGTTGTEQAALGVSQRDLELQRDLTLQQPPVPEVDVASPVELGRTPKERPKSRNWRGTHQPAPAARADVADPTTSGDAAGAGAATPEPVAAATPSQPVALVPSEAEPPDPHALPPGRSVTVIPASAGPATDDGRTHQGPSGRERGVAVGEGPHGGGCKPRGTGRMPGAGRPGAFR
jgi:hypothetical protein